jgi:hypothetical protein
MVAFRAFQRRIIDERKQHAIKHKNFQFRNMIADLDGQIHENVDNEYSSRIINEYETKHMNPKPVKNKVKNNVSKNKNSFSSTVSTRPSKFYVKGCK